MESSNFKIVFEMIIDNINGMGCDKANTTNELLSTIEYLFKLPKKAIQLRFINYLRDSSHNQAFMTNKHSLEFNKNAKITIHAVF